MRVIFNYLGLDIYNRIKLYIPIIYDEAIRYSYNNVCILTVYLETTHNYQI